jgi:hypothetical protein
LRISCRTDMKLAASGAFFVLRDDDPGIILK